jgi:hypothetical protein
MALIRAPRHAAIAVMALTASTMRLRKTLAYSIQTRTIHSHDALEVPISPIVEPAVGPFDTVLKVFTGA